MAHKLQRILKGIQNQSRTAALRNRVSKFIESLGNRDLKSGDRHGLNSDLEVYFDENVEGPGIWKWRHYFKIYDRYGSQFRGTKMTMLEIGIFSGGSLPMWRTYFGPACQVVGVDIESACEVYSGEGVKILIGDQADREFWRRELPLLPPLQFVVEDGGHQTEQQIVSFEEIFPHLAPGGVYICEDLHGNRNGFYEYAAELSNHLNVCQTRPLHGDWRLGTETEASDLARWIQAIHFYPFMVVIERNQQEVTTFQSEKHGTEWQPFLQ
jgi:hypothetical protein